MVKETHAGLRFYQSANAAAGEIKDGFIIRLREYGIIMDDIRSNPMQGSVQHYLLLGRRGSGKSTLLRRIQVEIDTDESLKAAFVAINLAEEQANIYRLYDLLDEIIGELESKDVVVNKPTLGNDENAYSRAAFAAIHEAIEQSGKKVILLLDNIDRILENLREDAGILREMLLNYSDLKIIGGSTRMTEHFWKYNQPFYQFFRVLQLERLSSNEMKGLLLHWSKKLDMDVLAQFVTRRPGQLEMVRLLTDGLPRTLQFFVNILVNHTDETGYEYLRQVMDQVTPLYQERLNSLPPAQRKIVLQLAFLWEAVGAKELAAATKMDNKVVSAQLKQLGEKGIAEKIETANKNHLYRLSERFFNLWLIFTQGSPKEKRKAKYLTVFLEHFYDAEELQAHAQKHLKGMGGIDPDKAALMTKAFAQSRYISLALRDALINKTEAIDGINEELKKQLPLTTANVINTVHEYIIHNHYDKAKELINAYEQGEGVKEYVLGIISYLEKDIEAAERYYLEAISKGRPEANYVLGGLYMFQNQPEKVEKYLLAAIKEGIDGASNLLGDFYNKKGEANLAETYWLQAAENNNHEAAYKLAGFYYGKDDDKTEYYFQQADACGNQQATVSLAGIYYRKAIKPNRALELIKTIEDFENNEWNDFFLVFELLISVWTGDTAGLREKLLVRIEDAERENLAFILAELLIHHQTNLIYNLFTDESFGNDLITRFTPLYYATSLLAKKGTNISLKIPPEIQETVDEILQNVKEGQERYYPKQPRSESGNT